MTLSIDACYLRPTSLLLGTKDSYKESTAKRSKKLENFFGSAPPLDISVTDIKKNGLSAILLSRVPLAYFLYQILQEHSCENLFFLLEVDHYESTEFNSINHQRQAAHHICETYLSKNSHFEINVDQKISNQTIENIKSDEILKYAFSSARMAILLLLENSFQTFTKSDVYKRMEKEIGCSGLYTSEGRESAVFLLKKHLKKMPQSTEGPSLRRTLLIKHMVQEFCFVMLDIDMQSLDDKKSSGFSNWMSRRLS
ncbi:hypothetical protein HK099_001377 [Clydaea vesicula]|uniref:RGS domain-containing protein n=1 Tax=Clydaea vesicula TaxID=447962 RepID=A0AAD5TTR0_9FUNG|nr:hypothetical protein HK099_001377 [Clydaea vesicula]KAJ3379377.1 hypothetical protein HDU92_006714 [Lobulomyces angularis]